MPFKHREIRIVFGLMLALAVASMGCGLTEGLGGQLAGDSAEPTTAPTRTPWPTFTPTPESVVLVPTQEPSVVKLSDLATAEIQPPDTLPTAPLAADAPTPPPPPTDTPLPVADTPAPPPANTPAPAPTPAAPAATPTSAAPPPEPTPAFQFTPLAWEGQWNAGLAQIRGIVRDAAGNTVNGVFVQAKCGSTVLASNPSGVNLYAPGEPYEAGAFDIILSSPLSANSMCNWEVRVVQASNFDEAKNLSAPSISPVGYCDLALEEMSICFANWQKNW